MSDREERYEDVDTSHLDDVEDGCGCTEMWEHTSGGREAEEQVAEGRQAEGREADARGPEEETSAEPSD